jgi:transposase
MIAIPSGVRIWIATGHTDMRKGMQGLALLVQEQLKRDPHAGDLFVFRGRGGSLVKVLWHDGLGMSLYAKRLDRGRFVWPVAKGGAVALTAAQLGYMLEGIDWRNPQHTWRPASAGEVQSFFSAPAFRGATSGWIYDSIGPWTPCQRLCRMMSKR